HVEAVCGKDDTQAVVCANNHCIGTAIDAAKKKFEFAAECATSEDPNNVKQLGCKGVTVATSSEFVYTSKANDFTLVKLNAGAAALSPYSYLQARASGAVLGEQIYIPQHPAARASRRILVCGRRSRSGTPSTRTGSPVLSAKDNVVVALPKCGGCLNGGLKYTPY
ncbi:hypothetical protein DYB35_013736, partial [Aphanomyces astaci]